MWGCWQEYEDVDKYMRMLTWIWGCWQEYEDVDKLYEDVDMNMRMLTKIWGCWQAIWGCWQEYEDVDKLCEDVDKNMRMLTSYMRMLTWIWGCWQDKLTAAVKASVVKDKDRWTKFSVINSPPKPLVTRWGWWLKVAEYYAKTFRHVREIVHGFEGTEPSDLKAKEAIAAESLPRSQRENYQCCINLLINYKEQTDLNMKLLKLSKRLHIWL